MKKLSVKTKHGFSASRWASYIEKDGYEFWSTLMEIFKVFKLTERNKKIAIMLPTIKLIKLVEQNLKDLNLNLNIGLFIGEVKKEKRILELDKNIILTNDKIFDKAIDVKDLEVLINFVPFASLVKTEQIIGRLRYGKDKSSVLIDVTDYGFEECIKQFKIRRRFYKKKAKKIIEIERN